MLAVDAQVVAALLGAAVGSILTVILGLLVSNRQEKRKQKFQVLLILVGGRGRIFSDNVADHLNAVPIVFRDVQTVRSAYQHFCAVVPRPYPNHELYERYTDLVIEIAKSLGFSRALSRADIQLGFFPGQFASKEQRTEG